MVLLVAAPPVAVMIALMVVLTVIIVCVAIVCLCREQQERKHLECGAAFVKISEKAVKCSAVTTGQVGQARTAATDYGIVSSSVYEKLPMAAPSLDVADGPTGPATTAALDPRGDYSCVPRPLPLKCSKQK